MKFNVFYWILTHRMAPLGSQLLNDVPFKERFFFSQKGIFIVVFLFCPKQKKKRYNKIRSHNKKLKLLIKSRSFNFNANHQIKDEETRNGGRNAKGPGKKVAFYYVR